MQPVTLLADMSELERVFVSDARQTLLDEKARLEAEIAELQASQRLLSVAIGELAHDGRRLSDALERVGGHDRALEGRRRTLRKSQSLSQTELEVTSGRLEALGARLREIETQLR